MGAVYFDAKLAGPLFSRLFPKFHFAVLSAIGKFSGLFPFSLFGAVCVLLGAAVICLLVLCIIKRRGFLRLLSAILAFACFVLFDFTALWGCAHFGGDLYERLSLDPADYTAQNLFEAGRFCVLKANEALSELEKEADGTPVIGDFDDLARKAERGFVPVNAVCPGIFVPEVSPKPLMFSTLLSYMGFTGFYFCYTGEACVNRNAYPSAIPLTICHELSHSIMVASEDEANFLGFLACLNADDPVFEYSAWYMGYIWCSNSLYKIDKKSAAELSALCSADFRNDLNMTNEHYDRYDGELQEASQSVNNAYLEIYGEELGVESYEAAVSYLVSWYLSGCPLMPD